MTSKLPVGAIIAALLGLYVCVPAALAADIPEYPFVFVVGRAEVDLPPNITKCSLSVQARDADAGKAAAIVDERLKSVLATLGANHVQAADIESFDIQKQAVTRQRDIGEPVTIDGYDISRNVTFKLQQFESLPPIEDVLTSAPNVTGLNCQFDRTDRRAQEAQLLTKALLDARDQADRLASPLARHVVAAAAISQSPFDSIGPALLPGNRYGGPPGPMFRRSVQPDDLLVPASIHLFASVNVLFKLD
jgi:uncharacterized protein YggE